MKDNNPKTLFIVLDITFPVPEIRESDMLIFLFAAGLFFYPWIFLHATVPSLFNLITSVLVLKGKTPIRFCAIR